MCDAFFTDRVHEPVDRHEFAFELFEFGFRRFEEGVLKFRGDIDLGDAAFDDFLHVFHRRAAAAVEDKRCFRQSLGNRRAALNIELRGDL